MLHTHTFPFKHHRKIYANLCTIRKLMQSVMLTEAGTIWHLIRSISKITMQRYTTNYVGQIETLCKHCLIEFGPVQQLVGPCSGKVP